MSFMGIGVGKQAEASQPNDAPAAKAKAKLKSGFMAGKSLIAAVEKPKNSGESFLYKMCPVHWDDNTMKMILVVAAVSWMSGFLRRLSFAGLFVMALYIMGGVSC